MFSNLYSDAYANSAPRGGLGLPRRTPSAADFKGYCRKRLSHTHPDVRLWIRIWRAFFAQLKALCVQPTVIGVTVRNRPDLWGGSNSGRATTLPSTIAMSRRKCCGEPKTSLELVRCDLFFNWKQSAAREVVIDRRRGGRARGCQESLWITLAGKCRRRCWKATRNLRLWWASCDSVVRAAAPGESFAAPSSAGFQKCTNVAKSAI